jgi:hypothetical protein
LEGNATIRLFLNRDIFVVAVPVLGWSVFSER